MIFTWDIDPVLFEIGPVAIRYYGVFFAGGLMVAAQTAAHFFRKRGLSEDDLNTVLIWMVVSLIVCAHWVHIIFYEPESIWQNPRRIIEFGSGLASHGGALGVIGAVWWYTRRKGIPFYTFADPLAASAVWIVPAVRIGNFFNSEIYGRMTDGSWGVVFARRGLMDPRHPSQLYEAAIGLVIVLFLMAVYQRYHEQLKAGFTFWLMLLLYFSTRFGVEYFKEYQILASGSIFTMGQWLSLPVMGLAAYMMLLNPSTRIQKTSAE